MDSVPPTADAATLDRCRQVIDSHMRLIPDYPKPGVLFRDITPVLAAPEGLSAMADGMAALCPAGTKLVAGIEARGFVLGTPVALEHRAGFVAVRKQGKLPGPTYAVEYDLEYGSAVIEIPQDAVRAGDEVVVVDDILATGGTADAACRLIEQAGAKVTRLVFLMELEGLGGRDKLAGRDVQALVSVPD